MAGNSSGYNQKIATSQNIEVQKQGRQAFISSLNDLQSRLHDARGNTKSEGRLSSGKANEEFRRLLTPATFSRRVLLPTDQLLNEEGVLTLNRVYSTEQESLGRMQDMYIDKMLNQLHAGQRFVSRAFIEAREEKAAIFQVSHEDMLR